MIGAFSISGFPLFNGFVSKSAIIAAAFEDHLSLVGMLLLLASVGTFLHTGLKIPYFVWFGPDRGIKPDRAPTNMYVAMGIGAFLCTLIGVAPGLLYAYLPNRMTWGPYTLHHIGETVQILTLTFVAFWLLRPKLAGQALLPIDTDWLYRKPLAQAATGLVTMVNATFALCSRSTRRFAIDAQRFLANPVAFWRGKDHKTYDNDEDRPTIAVSAFLALVLVGVLAYWVAG
jgi:multicomponent Na+:H+ antiporter subunit D